jgi:osmoprotectant transport system substrate-binding protein
MGPTSNNVLAVNNVLAAALPRGRARRDRKDLPTADLAELNRKVDAGRAKPKDAAKAYLEAKGLLEK